jgi:hypothetical protein
LIQLGAEWLIEPEEKHEFEKEEWDSREAMLSSIFPVPSAVLDFTRNLIERRVLKVAHEEIGAGQLWWHGDPPLYSDTLYGVGPPWTTSMTDRAWW